MEEKVTAYLGLGSNLGDRLETLYGARQSLHREPAVAVTASAPLYETAPVGGPEDQPPYLNTVLKIETVLSPERLLELCQEIENRFGRRRQERWGARSLDIDILFYASVVRLDPGLILPHPRLHQRSFVLSPLVDLEPELVHPVVCLTVDELLRRLDSTEGVQRVARMW